MITCQLGDKKYSVNTITGRALREIGPASDMYVRLSKLGQSAENGEKVDGDNVTIAEALDTMVQWFCVLFNNQFTPDDIYDNYPSDRLVSDVALAVLAVQNQMSSVLSEFPTPPTTRKAVPKRKVSKKG